MFRVKEIFEDILQVEGSALFYSPSYYTGGMSFIFMRPEIILTARTADEFLRVLDEAERLRKEYTGYSYISYEAGYLLEERLQKFYDPARHGNIPAAKFVFFNKNQVISVPSSQINPGFDEESKYILNNFHLNTTEEEYTGSIRKIKDYIQKGDTYQVNYTVKGRFDFSGEIDSLFSEMLFNQSAKYTAFINDVNNYILSFSPELFFDLKARRIKTVPMKGTIKRGINSEEDLIQLKKLKNSEKDLAENVMIVDLLRNDLGRICDFGTVKTGKLYEIEKYESLFQMVSTVKGHLRKEISLKEVIQNIFPCGSITGAPKISTMEIIHELEKEPRGIYTGSIGLLQKDEIKYNVAIRTLVIDKNTGKGEIGIGSGIVWDSQPEQEYKECLLKCSFLTNPVKPFEIFETTFVEKGDMFMVLDHRTRMRNAADYFLFKYDESDYFSFLHSVYQEADPSKKYRLRWSLTKTGEIKKELTEYTEPPANDKVIISKERILTSNRFQYFKTTNRQLYNSEYEKYKDEYADVIFLNERGEIAEGAITNIFIKRNGQWYTPPVSAGILKGTYRQFFIDVYLAKEKILYPEDLSEAESIVITNSLRQTIKINQVHG